MLWETQDSLKVTLKVRQALGNCVYNCVYLHLHLRCFPTGVLAPGWEQVVVMVNGLLSHGSGRDRAHVPWMTGHEQDVSVYLGPQHMTVLL